MESRYKAMYKAGFAPDVHQKEKKIIQETRKANRDNLLTGRRKMNDTPKADAATKVTDARQTRLDKLKIWKEEKKKAMLEKKANAKPVFKYHHVDKEIGMPKLEDINKLIKGKPIDAINKKNAHQVNKSSFVPNNYKFKYAPKTTKEKIAEDVNNVPSTSGGTITTRLRSKAKQNVEQVKTSSVVPPTKKMSPEDGTDENNVGKAPRASKRKLAITTSSKSHIKQGFDTQPPPETFKVELSASTHLKSPIEDLACAYNPDDSPDQHEVMIPSKIAKRSLAFRTPSKTPKQKKIFKHTTTPFKAPKESCNPHDLTYENEDIAQKTIEHNLPSRTPSKTPKQKNVFKQNSTLSKIHKEAYNPKELTDEDEDMIPSKAAKQNLDSKTPSKTPKQKPIFKQTSTPTKESSNSEDLTDEDDDMIPSKTVKQNLDTRTPSRTLRQKKIFKQTSTPLKSPEQACNSEDLTDEEENKITTKTVKQNLTSKTPSKIPKQKKMFKQTSTPSKPTKEPSNSEDLTDEDDDMIPSKTVKQNVDTRTPSKTLRRKKIFKQTSTPLKSPEHACNPEDLTDEEEDNITTKTVKQNLTSKTPSKTPKQKKIFKQTSAPSKSPKEAYSPEELEDEDEDIIPSRTAKQNLASRTPSKTPKQKKMLKHTSTPSKPLQDICNTENLTDEDEDMIPSKIAKQNLTSRTPSKPPKEEEIFNKTSTPSDTSKQDLATAYISPFVTISRGKSSARKEYKIRMSQGGLFNLSPQTAKATGPEAGAAYFHQLLDNEIARIEKMCHDWLEYKNTENPPEEVCDMINVAIGQSKLLISKKFKQFRSLIEDCERSSPERPVTCTDLHGYWEMTYLQVENVEKRFENLENLRKNNWEEILPQNEVKKKRQGKKKVKKTTAKSQSTLRDLIKAQREKVKEQARTEDEFFVSTSTAIPMVPLQSLEVSVKTPRVSLKTPGNKRKSILLSVDSKTKHRNSSPGLAMIKASNVGKSAKKADSIESTSGKGILKTPHLKYSSKKSVIFKTINDPEEDIHLLDTTIPSFLNNTFEVIPSAATIECRRSSRRISRTKLTFNE